MLCSTVDLLLLVRLQIARRLRLRAQPLHGVHHVVRLREECVAELRDPVGLRRHRREDLGERDERLHARIPRLRGDGLHGVVALEVRVRARPRGGRVTSDGYVAAISTCASSASG